MTAFTGSTDCSPARLAVTRAGPHQVAEHILAAARYAETGKTGLMLSPGGFRTPPFGADGKFLAVEGTELVIGGGPHGGPPPGDPAFRNAPFGTIRTFRQIGTLAEAAAFFRDARARIRAAATPTRRTP